MTPAKRSGGSGRSRTSQRARAKSTRTKAPTKLPAKSSRRGADWRPAFLEAFAITGNVTHAARAAKVGRSTVYDALAADATFRAAVDDASETATDLLVEHAREYATLGVREPVTNRDGLVWAWHTPAGEIVSDNFDHLTPRRVEQLAEEGISLDDLVWKPVTVYRPNPQLLMFLLKGHRPSTYRDRVTVEHLSTGELERELDRAKRELAKLEGENVVPIRKAAK